MKTASSLDIRLREEPCPVCGSEQRDLLGVPGRVAPMFQSASQVHDARIARCASCTAMHVHPMIYFSDELLHRLYNVDYFAGDGAVRTLKNMGEKHRIMRIVQRSRGGSVEECRMLDVGCGTGEFLVAGSKVGMRVTGIDVDESLAKHVRSTHGFEVRTGLLSDGTFPPASFDVVVLSHVIEHVQAPRELLRTIHGVLAPGGLLVMTTPNTDSLMEIVHDRYGRIVHGRRRCYFLSPFISPYHLVGFNLRSARSILERSGFEPLYAKVWSGLEWADSSRVLTMKVIKALGALVRMGMNIVTVSRKVS